MKISKNKKKCVSFSCPKDHSTKKNRFLGQKVCSVARVQTDTQTDTKVNTEDTLSGFQKSRIGPIFDIHFVVVLMLIHKL